MLQHVKAAAEGTGIAVQGLLGWAAADCFAQPSRPRPSALEAPRLSEKMTVTSCKEQAEAALQAAELLARHDAVLPFPRDWLTTFQAATAARCHAFCSQRSSSGTAGALGTRHGKMQKTPCLRPIGAS